MSYVDQAYRQQARRDFPALFQSGSEVHVEIQIMICVWACDGFPIPKQAYRDIVVHFVNQENNVLSEAVRCLDTFHSLPLVAALNKLILSLSTLFAVQWLDIDIDEYEERKMFNTGIAHKHSLQYLDEVMREGCVIKGMVHDHFWYLLLGLLLDCFYSQDDVPFFVHPYVSKREISLTGREQHDVLGYFPTRLEGESHSNAMDAIMVLSAFPLFSPPHLFLMQTPFSRALSHLEHSCLILSRCLQQTAHPTLTLPKLRSTSRGGPRPIPPTPTTMATTSTRGLRSIMKRLAPLWLA